MSSVYSITNYLDLYNSYINRLVPYQDKHKYIDFLTRFFISHGYLRGSLTKISAFLAQKAFINAPDEVTKSRIETILDDLDYMKVQHNVLLNGFVYDYVAVLYMPKQILEMKCDSCSNVFNIDDSYEYTFEIRNMAAHDEEYKTLKRNSSLPRDEKRQYSTPYGLKCTCPNCGTEFIQVPDQKWDHNVPGKLKILNPHHYDVFKNDGGDTYIRITADEYRGALEINTELEWEHISGLTWPMIVTFAAKDQVFKPNKDFYEVFSMNEIAALNAGASLSSIVSTISDLAHIDILKLGNEGIALSKVNPLYMITPNEASMGGTFEVTNHEDFRDFIVQEVREKEEGDFNRMVYSPISASAQPIFGDGKRFLALNEIIHYQNTVITALGFSPDILQGGNGLQNDPFSLKTMDVILDSFTKKFENLLENIIKRQITSYNKAKKDHNNGKPLFFLEKISLSKGTLDSQIKMDLVNRGELPRSAMLNDIGYPDLKHYYAAKRDEQLTEMREQAKTQRAVDKLQQQLIMEAQEQQAITGRLDTSVAEQELLRQAEEQVQMMAQMEHGQRKSYFNQLKNESPVLYSVTLMRWEEYQNMQNSGLVGGQQL